jgi:hypothetical protein
MIEPGKNLTIENVPSIPAELAESVRKYTESKRLAAAAGIRSGVRCLSENARVTSAGSLADVAARELKQLTNFPDPVGGGSWQPTTGNYFVFFKATGGNEISQLYRYDADSGNVTRLTTDDKNAHRRRAVDDGRRPLCVYIGPDRLAAPRARRSRPSSIRSIPQIRARLETSAVLDGVGWAAAHWSPDDKKLLVGKYVSATRVYIYLYDVASGRRRF